jgi:HTH-type transcriptional regulator/antitoxin HigA
MRKAVVGARALPRDFHSLNRLLPLRPIRDDVDLENAKEIMDALAVRAKRSRDQEDYLESLTTLVEAYEDETEPPLAQRVDSIEALKMLLEAHDMSGSDLGRLLGNRELGPAILRGDRQLSKAHIARLAARFKVSTDLFLL